MAQTTPIKKTAKTAAVKAVAAKTPKVKAKAAAVPAKTAKPVKAAKAPAVKAPAKKAVAPVKAKVALKAKPASAPAPAAKPKIKLVRDSFTMPRGDHDLISLLKTRTLVLQRATKKSELLRAGLHALAALGDKQLLAALNSLQPLKAGRPKAD